jgi:hypothetical protein
MGISSSTVARYSIRGGALFVAIALVLVPTILRAKHYSIQHQTVRLSVRLNWNGDKAQTKTAIPTPDSTQFGALPIVVEGQEPSRVAREICALNEPPPDPPLDSSPDTLRGPPPFFLV